MNFEWELSLKFTLKCNFWHSIVLFCTNIFFCTLNRMYLLQISRVNCIQKGLFCPFNYFPLAYWISVKTLKASFIFLSLWLLVTEPAKKYVALYIGLCHTSNILRYTNYYYSEIGSFLEVFKQQYISSRLIGSRIIEPAAYCNQKLLAHLYLNSTQNTSVNWIIRLLLSLLCWPKVILLSGGHCSKKISTRENWSASWLKNYADISSNLVIMRQHWSSHNMTLFLSLRNQSKAGYTDVLHS